MRSRAVWITLAFLMPGLAVRAGSDGLTVVAVGDVNMGTDFPSADFLPPDGGAGLFAGVKQYLAGDVVFGNLEGPLVDGAETIKCGKGRNCYTFRTPSSYTRHLKDAGFTVMSLANNHALDFGEAGRQSSMEQLDKVGIAHSGPKGEIASLRVRGKKVALVAFTSSSHSYDLLDIGASAGVIREVAGTHDLVIVSFHGGDEGTHAAHVPDAPEFLGREPRGHLIQFSHAVIDAGADLVLGHGPHLLRGMEIYRGRLIDYSLGNFCTYGRFNLSGPLGRAVVLEVTLDPDSGEFRSGRMRATIQHVHQMTGGPRPDPAKGGIADVRRLSAADFPYTAPRIDAYGRILPGASMGHGLFALNTAEDRAAVAALLGKLKGRKIEIKDLVRWFGDERAGLNEEVIERFAHPAEKVYTYPRYRRIFMRPGVLDAGKRFLEDEKELLGEVEGRYDVDRQAVAGIIAAETRFGERRGEYRVFNALATQALKMKRRSRWATNELAALFKVFDDDPLAVMGSYAGAVGLVQFMPTSILSYGQDWDGDGKIDLDNWPDALASCANYLKGKGWKRGQPIERGKANYKAIYRYNPSRHYARVVAELAHVFGFRGDGTKKKADPKREKPSAGTGASD